MAETVMTAPGVHSPPAGAPEIPAFEIVPAKGLPIVAIVLVALVVALTSDRLWAVEFAHVVGGGMWTAIDLFVGLLIGPIIGRLSIQARVEFLVRFMPKMLLLMPTLVTMTLASGWQIARFTGDWAVDYPQHWWLTASFVIVGIMSVIALGVLEPANLAILFELKKERPNGELIGKLTRRFAYTAGITGLMQVGILIIMTKVATW